LIDTVQIFSPSELVLANVPSTWRRSSCDQPTADPNGIGFVLNNTFTFDDPVTGYHGYGEHGELRYHRASLPRLLHGQNGKLLNSQTAVDAALNLLQQKAGEICNFNYDVDHFTRVDLVWQFCGDAADFILAHRNARHPRIRSGPSFYEARSMAFNGSELRIAIYDKMLERHKRNGDVVRVEVQLKGRVLKELLGNGDRVTRLDFQACYRAYRGILLGFQPSPITEVGSIAQFLALGEREGWQADGVPAFDLYTKGLCAKQISRLKRDMAACRAEVFKIDWSKLLPADGPPAVVEVDEHA